MKKWSTVCILAALSASLLSVSEVHTQFGQHRCSVDFHAGTRTRCKRQHTLSQPTPLILSMQSRSSTGEKSMCSYRGNVGSVYLFVSGGWAGSWVRTKSGWWPAVVSSSSMQVKSGGHVLSLVWCYRWCVSDLMWPDLWTPKLLVSVSLLIWNQSRPEHELIHSVILSGTINIWMWCWLIWKQTVSTCSEHPGEFIPSPYALYFTCILINNMSLLFSNK